MVTKQDNNSPSFYAIAGVPTAGKTTFRIKAIAEGILPRHAFVHDCDVVMEALPGYQQQLAAEGPQAAFNAWELPARELAEARLLEQVTAKQDIIYDRSCALLSSYEFIRAAVMEHGYKLIMHVLYVDPDAAVQRALVREREFVRHSPQPMIRERVQMLSQLWPRYLELASAAYLLDNRTFEQTLIAEFKDNTLSVSDHATYQKFIAQNNA